MVILLNFLFVLLFMAFLLLWCAVNFPLLHVHMCETLDSLVPILTHVLQ